RRTRVFSWRPLHLCVTLLQPFGRISALLPASNAAACGKGWPGVVLAGVGRGHRTGNRKGRGMRHRLRKLGYDLLILLLFRFHSHLIEIAPDLLPEAFLVCRI